MSSRLSNEAPTRLYRNLKVEEGEDTDVKATRGLLARSQPDKARE